MGLFCIGRKESNMKLLIIRHGDPDYSIDSLTEKGWHEAELLAERLAKLDIRAFYVSPLGRARDTASLTLKKMNREAVECPWLREFSPKISRPDREGESICWDWLPQDWMPEEKYYDRENWDTTEIMQAGGVGEEYRWVTEEFDKLLAMHGYVREGRCYRTMQGNADTIALFCHFGVEAVLLSHLLNVSPMTIWHGFCAAPTSVTTIITEERRKGIASFRINNFADISHLYAAGEEPAFAARFCEVYENENERH